jgi:glycosyltransferase involved in cell wall biosynthesis
MPEISVITPAHNPRLEYLHRVLEALRGQTLPAAKWELLVIDNASAEPLDKVLDLSWHPRARVIREEHLGLTPARLRGFAEARAPLIVFTDDDNVLQNDYLEQALHIASRYPTLGAWSGRIIPEFEIPPPEEIRPFLDNLCLREPQKDTWGNSRNTADLPFGAGMCVRKAVAERYANEVRGSAQRIALGRKGTQLTSSEDLDLSLTAIDLGMGTGLFTKLVVTHLIPACRLSRNYICRLIEDSAMSHTVLERVRGIPANAAISGVDRLVAAYKLWRATPMQKAVHHSRVRGINRALRNLAITQAANESAAGKSHTKPL